MVDFLRHELELIPLEVEYLKGRKAYEDREPPLIIGGFHNLWERFLMLVIPCKLVIK